MAEYVCNHCEQRINGMGTHDCIGALWQRVKRLEGEVDDVRLWARGLADRIILLENRALRAATREGVDADGT